ncbi:hypothetical protein, partial [Klebsiella pneumoniae]|uniref:hypothetical protein n=1 Tax=Klebsiella pneumoniae TaxID=573 RepID=UPI001C5D9270
CVQHQLTVGYALEQNGVSERKNITIMETTRAMLLEKGLSKEKMSKLDKKTEKGIFLGYSTQSNGYQVYSLRTKKLIISMDVQFDKDVMYNWEIEKIENKSINLLAP